MILYVRIDNKKKDILIVSKDPIQELNDTTLKAEAQYSINFSRSSKKLCLSINYNGSKKFLFVNTTKAFQIRAKDSKIKKYCLCLRNISGFFQLIT